MVRSADPARHQPRGEGGFLTADGDGLVQLTDIGQGGRTRL